MRSFDAVIDPALVAQAQKLIHRARMISEAPAAQAGEIGHGHPSSGAPPGVVFTSAGSVTHSASTLEQVGARVNAAIAHDSEAELRAATAWATRELQALQHGPKQVVETPAQFRQRLCKDYEGVPAGKVAARERTSVTTVRDARVADGRSARDGYKLAARGVERDG
jgi:hypothetical protein